MSVLPGRIATGASAILLALCGCPLPASAAAPKAIITTHFQQLTLAPGAQGSEAMLWASIEGGDEADLMTVRYTVDYSGIAAFADLEVTEMSGYLSDSIGTLDTQRDFSSSGPTDGGCQKSLMGAALAVTVVTGVAYLVEALRLRAGAREEPHID